MYGEQKHVIGLIVHELFLHTHVVLCCTEDNDWCSDVYSLGMYSIEYVQYML